MREPPAAVSIHPRKPVRKAASARFRAAARRNLEKAWESTRRNWAKTPARIESSLRNIKFAHEANRRRPRKMSEGQIAALRQNMAKARAALNARGRSPEHLEKLRQGIARARTFRTPQGRIEQARKILSHGFYSRLLRDTPIGRLGEDPVDRARLIEHVVRYFAPANDEELHLVRALGDALWRFHRLHLAQAKQQIAALLLYLKEVHPFPDTFPRAIDFRAYDLLTFLIDQDVWWRREQRALGVIERLLRRLVQARAGRPVVWPARLYGPSAKPPQKPKDPVRHITKNDYLL